ncbi:MAG: hypothetical protein JJU29_02835 [Verrucomicrobia bacterium]|nr:hypothetical protein [Verrucomicrobiota bacterium]MCH8511430.1 hypothetical protein [Kiritimatiellia bacterium]
MKARISKFTRFLSHTHVPLMVYGAVAVAMLFIWLLRRFHEDFAFDLLAELIGVAFTVFIIDTLLVKSKTNRWRIVQENVDYLIARTINRLRDGVALRAFHFEPELTSDTTASNPEERLREQRAEFLHQLCGLDSESLAERLYDKELFSIDSYEYFKEKSEDLWGILNMKYSEYLEPDLVALLIDLHTRLKDVCGHIRHYRKAERFPGTSADHYLESGRRGATREFVHILRILDDLKTMGYSRPPDVLSEGCLSDKA